EPAAVPRRLLSASTRGLLLGVAAAVLFVGIGLGAWWVACSSEGGWGFWREIGGRPRPLLRVTSIPTGATVRIGDNILGQTPYVGENDLPGGEYALYVEKDGFEATRVIVKASDARPIHVKLTPRSGGPRRP
ncbi:MAG: PEGA domain-containing protein, partial [Deltaproteobacteria bacterium]|nr:PEGA domain-containing protein [Deltaproteobacteria bacterium]